jgi:hypothetical protein
MAQNEQLDALGELAAAATQEQPQQRREGEIGEGYEHPAMLPDPAAVGIERRNLVLKPLTLGASIRTGPCSVASVFGVEPLRVLPVPPGGSWCGS